MQNITFFHSNFLYSQTDSYHLSISFRRDGFSFIIVDRDADELQASVFYSIDDSLSYDEYVEECSRFLNHEAFSYSYKQISCMYSSHHITIAPKSLCKQDDLRTILQFNHEIDKDESVYAYSLTNSDAVLVYAVSQQLIDMCRGRFEQSFDMFPHSASLLESSILHNKLEDGYSVFISLESSFFDIVILHKGNIIMYNTFSFANINDYVYYIMNVFEQLQLNQMKTPVVLTGRISKTSSYYEATCMFIKNVTIVQPLPLHAKMIARPPFTDISYPLFYQLFTINICE
ncbi:MAG: DUF3822 family protein [Bacteroidales bacterium]